ncbi:hypothetical protein [Lactobacillus delbrueckii]|nr:hypothetical protein [Lactobacillus delbrueckii]MDA3849330.1 hypothetical protein [Lactobacillus delbrueckii]
MAAGKTKKPTLAGLKGYVMNDNHKGNVQNRNTGTKKVTRTTDRKRPPSK